MRSLALPVSPSWPVALLDPPMRRGLTEAELDRRTRPFSPQLSLRPAPELRAASCRTTCKSGARTIATRRDECAQAD